MMIRVCECLAGWSYVFEAEGSRLTLSLLPPPSSSEVFSRESTEHKVFLSSRIVALAVTPSCDWCSHEEEDDVIITLAFVALDGGEVFEIRTASLTLLQQDPQLESEDCGGATASTSMFSSLDDLVNNAPSPPLWCDEHSYYSSDVGIVTVFALGKGILLVSGRDGSAVLILPRDSVIAGGERVLSITTGSKLVTAAFHLKSDVKSHSAFRVALLSHLIGVENTVPLVLLGTADGNLLWLPLHLPLTDFVSTSSSNNHPRHLPVYFFRRFSKSSIVRMCITSMSSESSYCTDDNGNFHLCLVHQDCSIAFLRVSSKLTVNVHLLSDGNVLNIPIACKNESVTVLDGIVFAITLGGVLVAFVLQHEPASSIFFDKEESPVVLSGPCMKHMASFTVLSQSAASTDATIYKWQMCTCFSDGTKTAVILPFDAADFGSISDLGKPHLGLSFTRNQKHLHATNIQLRYVHAALATYGSFAAQYKSRNKIFTRLKNSGGRELSSIRSILTNITSVNRAKEVVLEKKSLIDNEIVTTSKLLQLLQKQLWPSVFTIQLDISNGMAAICDVKSNEYCGILTITTNSEVAMRAINGRILIARWKCCLSGPGVGANTVQTYSFNMKFKPTSNIQPHENCTYEFQATLPLQIDNPVPHELYLDVVVNTQYPKLLFSTFMSPLRGEVECSCDDGGRYFPLNIFEKTNECTLNTSVENSNSDGNSLPLIDIHLICIHKSMADILHCTGDLPVVVDMDVSNSSSSSFEPDGNESNSVLRSYTSKKRLSEVLGQRQLSTYENMHTLTSYVPVIPHDTITSSNLLSNAGNVARTLERSTSPNRGNRYSFKTTNVQVKSNIENESIEARSSTKPPPIVKAYHHRSNSKLVLSLLQAEFHSKLLETLEEKCASVENKESAEDSSSSFSDTDIYSLPYELQQVSSHKNNTYYCIKVLLPIDILFCFMCDHRR